MLNEKFFGRIEDAIEKDITLYLEEPFSKEEMDTAKLVATDKLKLLCSVNAALSFDNCQFILEDVIKMLSLNPRLVGCPLDTFVKALSKAVEPLWSDLYDAAEHEIDPDYPVNKSFTIRINNSMNQNN